MNNHPHPEKERELPPETPLDPGSQALSEALRSSFAIVKVVMVALVVLFFASGFFQVGPQEQAIILRFGKPVGEGREALLGPGLHWSFPYPIDEHKKIPMTAQQQVRSTVGWYATTDVQEAAGTEPPAGPTLNPAVDGYVLTADGNIIHVRATLFYRIDDPIQYVLGFASASNVVQNALNSALVHTAARFRVDDILTRDVAGFRDALTQRVAELLEQWNVGVSVDHCEVQSRPPRQVGNAFDEVLKAEINRNNVLNEARSTANQTLSQAAAQAQSITNAAELERVQLVSELSSLAANFDRVLPEYRKNPQLFVERSLNETLRRALTNVEKWSVPPAIGGKTTETRIWLNRELPRSAPGAASTP